MKSHNRPWRLVLSVIITAFVSLGCGPFNRPSMLDASSPLLRMPSVPLEAALCRIPLPAAPPFKMVVPRRPENDRYISDSAIAAISTRDADLAELTEALAARNMPEPKRTALLEQYTALRTALQKHTSDAAAWDELYSFEKKDIPRPTVPPLVVPDGLPGEFDLYATGAIAYHERRFEDAISAWKKLLDLPARERHYRSTWAAFMIGKVMLEEGFNAQPDEPLRWFEKTRSLALEGFTDRLGLAAESLGWEARVECHEKHFQRALVLYMLQRAAGADVNNSVRIVCENIFMAGPEAILSAAKDAATQRIATAWVITVLQYYPGNTNNAVPAVWLDAVEKAGIATMEDADRLAWIAYEAGDFSTAQRWLDHSPKDSVAAVWLRAKLLLRDNKPNEAAPLLAQVVSLLPKDPMFEAADHLIDPDRIPFDPAIAPMSKALGELGVIHLARRDFAQALNTLLVAGYHWDAVYLAERVLTLDELIACVDQRWPKPTSQELDSRDQGVRESAQNAYFLRDVLARRLIREGRLNQAREYLRDGYLYAFDSYAFALDEGRDTTRSNAERANALMRAARIAAHRWADEPAGWHFFTSETEPNWYMNYTKIDQTATLEASREKTNLTMLRPTEDERERVRATANIHESRVQSPYVAANLAWEAIKLMPDNTDETARALIEAGSWLKARDPVAADRFYKALVRRCGKTDLGREADKRRWFPPLPPEASGAKGEPQQ